jgi:hypothetical protein
MLHAPDDAEIRLVAQGLVKLVGTDAAAKELSRLYGSHRASEALCRSATTGWTMDLQDDIEVILDLADPRSPSTCETTSSRQRISTRHPRLRRSAMPKGSACRCGSSAR